MKSKQYKRLMTAFNTLAQFVFICIWSEPFINLILTRSMAVKYWFS